ncbi:uncharacterized protein LOC122042590 [Zingiber officinale]|uniref:Uncharacterized protein n=1 Tax=Zingiber officinale TaxID=94328 RepID=A0A8J5HL00_ZINOF|nr:uncharacterized protein LOC122042590 [Zingiber officinale]KAG6529648.1 hypothetical protein ZIOFF_011861 [Zingiber officinale]
MTVLEFPCARREAAPSPTMDRASGPTASTRSRRRAAPWRPSLVAISEDVALFAGDGAAKAARGGGDGPRKSRAKSTSRVVPRSLKEDYGLYGVAKVVPTFAPAAFIF